MFSKHGGITLYGAVVEITNSEFMVEKDADSAFFVDPLNEQVKHNMQGGFVTLLANSSYTSALTTYKNARSQVGGCVAMIGLCEAKFKNDVFENCAASVGGAIYGQDFASLNMANVEFKMNKAYSGEGEAVYAERFSNTLTFNDIDITSYRHNSMTFKEGFDISLNRIDIKNPISNMNWTDELSTIDFNLVSVNQQAE